MLRTLFVGAAALLPSLGLFAQVVRTPISSVPSDDGAAMYKAYCASCHGADGKGVGPASKALKVPATDLTKLAKYHDGEFPALQMLSVLSQPSGPHGSVEMPVWSEVFRQSGQDASVVHGRLYNLTKYIESIQDPPAAPKAPKAKDPARPAITAVSPASGGEMFRAYCASCHGTDGRGGGPAAWNLKVTPPDLTLLARENGGKFPQARVNAVLRHGTAETIHGSAEMPVWGQVFRENRESTAVQQVRIYNLLRYVESMQRQ